MKINNTILTERQQKYRQSVPQGKIDKYKYFTGKEILPSDQSRIKEQGKFIYSTFGKAFEKQVKAIEDQGEKQIKALEEHGKQLFKSSDKKVCLKHSKQK